MLALLIYSRYKYQIKVCSLSAQTSKWLPGQFLILNFGKSVDKQPSYVEGGRGGCLGTKPIKTAGRAQLMVCVQWKLTLGSDFCSERGSYPSPPPRVCLFILLDLDKITRTVRAYSHANSRLTKSIDCCFGYSSYVLKSKRINKFSSIFHKNFIVYQPMFKNKVLICSNENRLTFLEN